MSWKTSTCRLIPARAFDRIDGFDATAVERVCAIVQEEEMSGSSVAEAYNVMWGPVEEEIAKKYGALAGGQSILVRPVIDAKGEWLSLMERVRALIPEALLPCADDDTASLVRRLAASDFLDDIHVLRGGRGPQRVRLNATDYAQPRRVTWSVGAELKDSVALEGCVPLSTDDCRRTGAAGRCLWR